MKYIIESQERYIMKVGENYDIEVTLSSAEYRWMSGVLFDRSQDHLSMIASIIYKAVKQNEGNKP